MSGRISLTAEQSGGRGAGGGGGHGNFRGRTNTPVLKITEKWRY